MVLTDSDFKRLNTKLIEPFNPKLVQPSSYDLTLFGEFLTPSSSSKYSRIDLRTNKPQDYLTKVNFTETYLSPGECLLGSTNEIVKCPRNLTARVDGKSSIGRLFMAVHVTAGVIDAGWEGQITLEIVNHSPWEIVLWAGMPIAQLSYFELTGDCEVPYGSPELGSHYLGQRGPTAPVGERKK